MKKNINLSANGKLLLTGEYLVLVGAEALVFPVRFGQFLFVEPASQKFIHWVSKENGTVWFTCDLDPSSLGVISASSHQVANRLTDLLRAAKKINPGFVFKNPGLNVTVEANFPVTWGLGSSSTLTALIAGWAWVDKFRLFRMISLGSGYDIASTDRSNMFFYQLNLEEMSLKDALPGKALLNHTCFAYLGKKQETDEEVATFLSRKNFTGNEISRISEISRQCCKTDDPVDFCSLIKEHEEILGRILRKERIADHFPGFPGSVKSLGAWGGDFAMFASTMKNHDFKILLKQYGLNDIFTFEEMKVSKIGIGIPSV